MRLVIYDKINKNILASPTGKQTFESYCARFPDTSNMLHTYVDDVPNDYHDFKFENGKIIRMSDNELMNLRQSRKISIEKSNEVLNNGI